jgi:VWFA-related protein
MRNLALAVLGLASVLVVPVATGGQDRPSPRPQTTFKSAVDVVPVDVNVVDRDGRPVDDLQATAFSLAVDGRPRRIVSAEFVRMTPAPAPPPSTYFSTNENARAGRLIALVIDQGNISSGRARAAAESAIRFVKRLSPSDRVGLFVIPGPGPQISFTANHALVEAQLPRIVGHATRNLGPQRVGIAEALRIERGDQLALTTAADRECTGGERQMCMQELSAEARELVAETRDRTRSSLGPLRVLMDQLASSKAPKTVVYLSEALVVDEDRSELDWVGPLAAKGQIALHVIRIDAPAADASSSRRSFGRTADIAVAEEGLSILAGLARGSLFRMVGNADNIFNRLALEMSGYYLVGFEPEAGDRDGKPHKIKISVPGRQGINVRARQDFSIEEPRPQTDEEALAETLQSPLLASDIRLKATAYTFHDETSKKLRILIAADIDRSLNPAARIALGYALLDGSGNIVSSQFERQLKTPVNGNTQTQHFVAAALGGAPGVYGLKLAVVDEEGRRGSIQHAFRAQLTTAGELRVADLVIGENPSGGSAGAAPTVAGDFTDAEALHGYLELYADGPEALRRASVALEISAKEDSRALESMPARVDEGLSTASRRIAEGVLSIGVLPPGEYHARAVISVDGRKVGQVGRPFRVSRSTSTAAAGGPAGTRTRPRAAAPFSVRVDPFQRATVLTPQVVGHFFDRVGAGNRAAVSPEAIEHARAGRFDRALDATAGHALATAFLEGLALYARGSLDPAMVKFREALRIDSEFFPAIFYLGACYAAAGRDRDASAAWHTTLVSEDDAPFVYFLLADALLRQRSLDKALEILNEANTRWPDEPELQVRTAMASAMSGKSSDAVRLLDAYLARRPQDTERLFLALSLIYEAHAGGRSVGTPEEDRTRFDRYAAAYAANKGPQLALVEQWQKFIARR